MAWVTFDEDPPPEVLQSQGRERQEVRLPPRQKGHMGGRVSASRDKLAKRTNPQSDLRGHADRGGLCGATPWPGLGLSGAQTAVPSSQHDDPFALRTSILFIFLQVVSLGSDLVWD